MAPIPVLDKASLLAEIERNREKYDSRKDRNRAFAICIKIFSAVFGALIAILLGWKFPGVTPRCVTNTALILGGVISTINSLDAFFSFSSAWEHYKGICTRLILFERDINVEESEDIDKAQLSNLKVKLNAILIDAREGEVALHRKRNENSPQS